jgi:hypothetical protein
VTVTLRRVVPGNVSRAHLHRTVGARLALCNACWTVGRSRSAAACQTGFLARSSPKSLQRDSSAARARLLGNRPETVAIIRFVLRLALLRKSPV